MITLNNKAVDTGSLELSGVDGRDAPDFSDAHFSAGLWQDGTKMSDEDLDALKEAYPDYFYDRVYNQVAD